MEIIDAQDKTIDKTIGALRAWLIGNPNYFKDGITDCHTIHDVIYFKQRNPRNIVFQGDRFLCDIYSNELWVVELVHKSVYDKIRKQKLRMLPIAKIIDDCASRFPRFNGYWQIPAQFISKDGE